jgi:hypothetical protein
MMSQGKKIDMDAKPGGVEQALLDDDYAAARKAMAIRLARMFDSTDSARDVKALSISLSPIVDRCEQDFKAVQDTEQDTPLNRIMEMAANA